MTTLILLALIASSPILEIHRPLVQGPRELLDVQNVPARHYDELMACNPDGHVGLVSVKFLVDANGDVDGVTIQQSEIDDVGVQTCIVSEFRDFDYGPVRHGVTLVTQPIRFTDR